MSVRHDVLALFGTAAVACCAVAPGAASAATVAGELATPSVVWVDDGSVRAPAFAEMRNAGKAFVPNVLVVPAGSTVRFPNDDPFFHSIYSVSAPNEFDIGFYSTGPGKDETFAAAGIVDVHCHIHVGMHATIVVVSGPFANAASDTFSLDGVRPGVHTMYAWSAASGLRTISIRVPLNGSLSLDRPL